MPELPEVETIKNELSPSVIGRKIMKVDIVRDDVISKPSADEFREKVTGKTITGITRRGKYLFFHLDKSDDILTMHLKLAGSLQLDPETDKFTRAVLHLDDETDVHLKDPRKFGRMWLEKDESAVADRLGPEPFDKDFTVKTLAEILKKRSSPVKVVILDQSLIAGIGNMYADEALFEAKIHPARPAKRLSPAEVERLYDAIKNVLRKGIEKKGASVRDYFRPSGEKGEAHTDFLVAHGAGNSCPGCAGKIERIVVGGRGTYICPRCQPEP